MSSRLEAKICILGAQGVGKTSLVQRYIHGTFTPSKTTSTVGASFLTKRTTDIDSGCTVRLQIWDTAGQERFHSITKLYYRGASAVILVYSIVDETSFKEMGRWLREVQSQLGDDVILHIVGTKADVVAQDPGLRQVPFERCIAFIAENLQSSALVGASATTPSAAGSVAADGYAPRITRSHSPAAENTKRLSGAFWGNDIGWDICHEISASSGEGIEEVFRVITRKLVEKATTQQADPQEQRQTNTSGRRGVPATPNERAGGYFDRLPTDNSGQAFTVGAGNNRRSWLGFPTPNLPVEDGVLDVDVLTGKKKKKKGCC